MAKDTKAPRMTRAQINEALETVPLDTILLGSNTGGRLTPKQREFARNLALGKSKAQAYRESHNSKGNSKTQANNGYKLAQQSDIQTIKAAYEQAIEAAKQRTPAQLRELVIHQLTNIALNGEKESNRVSALKMLGQVTEVAAFTERRETTTIRKSEDVRAALMEKLQALTANAVEGELVQRDSDADSLLAEISKGSADVEEENGQPSAGDIPPAADPTRSPPPIEGNAPPSNSVHNVLLDKSVTKSVLHKESAPKLDSSVSDGEIIGVDVEVTSHMEVIAPIVAEKVPAEDPTPSDMETPPVNGTKDLA